jgi:hypothetical protein
MSVLIPVLSPCCDESGIPPLSVAARSEISRGPIEDTDSEFSMTKFAKRAKFHVKEYLEALRRALGTGHERFEEADHGRAI